MKRKIIIGLSIFSLIFFLGGVYIIVTIQSTTSQLDRLITLHQVEILREHLLLNIKRVQADLSLKNSRHARSIDTIVLDVQNMISMANICSRCHHSPEIATRLSDLREHIENYRGIMSRALTVRADTERVTEEEDEAYKMGEGLIEEVNNMISIATVKLVNQTTSAMKGVKNTKYILFFLVAMAPILATGLGFIFIRAFTKPLGVVLEATRRLRSGELDYKIGPLKDECGEVARSFNEMSSSLKDQMNKIEESEKRYRLLFEAAGDAIFILQGEGEKVGHIVAANRAAAEMHGYTKEELLELNIVDLDAPDAAAEALPRIERIIGGEWLHFECNHYKKDRSVFPVEVSAGLIEMGNQKYVLAMDRDITERKRAEDALHRAEHMKLAGEMAAGLAHEIKNPLAGIKVSIEIFSEEASLSEEDKDLLAKVIGEIKRIETLIKSLLNFARPPKPQLSLVDVHEILDSTLAFTMKDASPKAGSAAIKIVKNYDGHLPMTSADPMQLQQAFMNLLLNAKDSMPKGGTLGIKTFYDPNLKEIQIELSDTGKGINQNDLVSIFRPFYTTKAKGTGLGLAITKRLIEDHGGLISVESKPGLGTAFRISLPVRQDEVLAAR